MTQITEHRSIELKQGGTLEIEIMPGFYDKVRSHFGLSSDSYIDDDRLRMFLYGSVKTALDKVNP